MNTRPEEPTAAPSSSPSFSMGPSSLPSIFPSDSPSMFPSKSSSPSSSPSSPPSDGSCNQIGNTCGYTIGTDNTLVASYFAVCIHDNQDDSYGSHCLHEDDLIEMDQSVVAKCGCCSPNFPEAREAKETKFCGCDPLSGPPTCHGSICGESKDGKAKVEYCFHDKSKDKMKTTCKDPRKRPLKDEDDFESCGTCSDVNDSSSPVSRSRSA